MVAEGCKQLIENAINCWNYLYLSQLLLDSKTPEERQRIIESIKNGSVVAWQHLNM